MSIIQILYLAAGIIFSAAFVPQIIRLYRDTTGAASVSLLTWGLFSACNIITLLYAAQANHDGNFILTATLGTIGNLSVFGMALWRRYAPVLIRKTRG